MKTNFNSIVAEVEKFDKQDKVVRNKIKEYLLEKLANTNENDTLKVDIIVENRMNSADNFDIIPELTELFIDDDGYIVFIIDDVDTYFDDVMTNELIDIVNKLEELEF